MQHWLLDAFLNNDNFEVQSGTLQAKLPVAFLMEMDWWF